MKVSGGCDPKQAGDRDVSHFMRPPAAVARLCAQHGEVGAREIALKEQRRAKRARSKRRFVFWSEVATQITHAPAQSATFLASLSVDWPRRVSKRS